MDKSIIYLGAGDNLSDEDKRDRLYTIGFVVVIIIIFIILAVVVGGSYFQGAKPVKIMKPAITPTPEQAVQSGDSSDQQLIPVKSTPVPTEDVTPTSKPALTNTPTPTSVPPTNTPVPPTSTPVPPTNTPVPPTPSPT